MSKFGVLRSGRNHARAVSASLRHHRRDLSPLSQAKFVPDVTAIAARLRGQLEKLGWAVMDADPNPFWIEVPDVAREDWTGQKLM